MTRKVTAQKATFGGSKALVVTALHTAKVTGARDVYTLWVEDAPAKNGGYAAGTITHRWIDGDGRYADKHEATETKVVTRESLPADVRDKF